MPAQDPWGSGSVSWRERMERAYAEMRRRIKTEAKNDPNFVPRNNDASYILAARHFVVPPAVPERGHDDANDMLANRAFAKRSSPSGTGTPRRVPWTLVLRDALADFEARRIALEALIAVVGASYDFQLLAPDLTAILQVPTGTKNVEIPQGSLKVSTGFGCNGKGPQLALASGAAAGAGSGGAGTVAGTAGATYTATEQGLINALIAAVNAQAAVINALAAQVTANATASNTMRTALIADGILV